MYWWKLIRECYLYGIESRKWWLGLLLFLLLAVSWFLSFAESSLILPYLYPLF